ncbi:aminomethyltransferase beta-barrel domain-containing protein, partial [Cellulomonas sp. 179-A 9B4 NHS]|uniref:aminomethyltransferase beta-barrel domain-containing protein n=1 Tax=Cellulomonas sp. 179-A 9B4 NHS TaxID=3142379 RepID=UPI0039A00ED5
GGGVGDAGGGGRGLRGVAAGQSLVLYDGTRVVGQGTVRATVSPAGLADARAHA